MALNDKYDAELKCVDCGSYYCTSKFGGDCPKKQMDLFKCDCDHKAEEYCCSEHYTLYGP